MNFEARVLLLRGYFHQVALQHLDGVELGFFQARLDLLADFPLQFLEVGVQLVLGDEHQLVRFFCLLAFSLDIPGYVTLECGQFVTEVLRRDEERSLSC